MKAAGYIRVSSEMQIETGHSLDAQRTLIAEFVRAGRWTLVEIFCDAGLSGTLSNRPALRELMSRAKHHDFDVVVVHAIGASNGSMLFKITRAAKPLAGK